MTTVTMQLLSYKELHGTTKTKHCKTKEIINGGKSLLNPSTSGTNGVWSQLTLQSCEQTCTSTRFHMTDVFTGDNKQIPMNDSVPH